MYQEEVIEKEIIKAMESEITELEILPYQNDIQDFECEHPFGSILVSYNGTNPTEQGPILEEDDVKFGIDLIFRNINTHTGAFPVMRKIRNVMKSLDFNLKSKIFLDIYGDEWHYTMIFSKVYNYMPGE